VRERSYTMLTLYVSRAAVLRLFVEGASRGQHAVSVDAATEMARDATLTCPRAGGRCYPRQAAGVVRSRRVDSA